MRVYELIQELTKYPPDAEVMIELNMKIDGPAERAVQNPKRPEELWVEDFMFDDLLTIKSIEPEECFIDETGKRKCPRINLTY